MSDEDRVKWDERYATGEYEPRQAPTPLLETAIRLITPGRALVLACGTGRNALRLAESGFAVEAVDISEVAIEKAKAEATRRGIDVSWRVADIDDLRFDPNEYALITMVRYLDRDIWPTLVAALEPDGWLLMVQHFRTRREVLGPSDPAFRLEPGELLRAFPTLRIVHYTESVEHSPEKDRLSATASMLACKGDPGW